MSESTKPTLNKAKNGNKSKPLLCDVFDKKYVIIGEIFFDDSGAEIVSILKEEMIYNEGNLNDFLDFAENNGYDYMILPDYKLPFMAIKRNCSDKVNRIKTMAKDIGWSSNY